MSVRKATTNTKTAKQQKQQDRETIRSLIETITSYWPDLKFHEDDFNKPTSNFVFNFYCRFYNEFEQKLSETFKILLDPEQQQDLEVNKHWDEVSLTVKLKELCKEFNALPFYLSDICDPQPKRTAIFSTLFMNLLLYVSSTTNFASEISEIVDEKTSFQKAYVQKQDMLKKIQDLNICYVKSQDNLQQFCSSIENLSEEYKLVLVQRAEKDIEHKKDILIIDKLKENLKNISYNINKLNDEVILLQKQVVNEGEVEELKSKKCLLTKDLEKLDLDRRATVVGLEKQEEKIKDYNKCLEGIKNSYFGSDQLKSIELSLENYFSITKEANNLASELSNKKIENNDLKSEIVLLEERFLNVKCELQSVKSKIESNEHKLRETLGKVSEIVQRNQTVFKNYEEDIAAIEECIGLSKSDLTLLEEGVEKTYVQLIENEARIHNTFNNTLMKINNYLKKL